MQKRRKKNDKPNFLGDEIRIKRQMRGLSMEELAFELDVVYTTLSNWELGKTIPSYKHRKKLNEVLDFSLEEQITLMNKKQ